MFYSARKLIRLTPLTLYLSYSCAEEPPRQLSTADVCDKVLPSVFRIILYHPQSSNTIIGIGSAFFIKRDGTALTAYHVLTQNARAVARLESGEELEIEKIKGHSLTDIALIKVKVKKPVPVIELGDSNNVRRGEQVMHIGNTVFSDSNDIDVGYVNKLQDDTPDCLKQYIQGDPAPPDSGLNFIKTSGSVRPGFSGGPLVNMYGQAVGLISRCYVQMHPTGVQNEGASIPINFVKSIVKQLEISGKVERPYVGLSFTPHDPGLGVVKVQPGSPAEKAGLKVGDIILEANGKLMRTPEDFYKAVGYTIGVVLNVKALRDKQYIEVIIRT